MKIVQKIIPLAMLLLLLAVGASAQKNSKLSDRLWYGANFALNFRSSFNTSLFEVGLAPMVGYKITDKFSVGPRVSGTLSFYRFNTGFGEIQKAQPVTWSVGLFSRYKVYRQFFAQVEYAFENEALGYLNVDGLQIDRQVGNNVYIGGGYSVSSGSRTAFEVSILYHVNQSLDDFSTPLQYRFGINYNF